MRFEKKIAKIELTKYYPTQDISEHLEFLIHLHLRFLGAYIIPSWYCITIELSHCIKCHKTKNREENCAKYQVVQNLVIAQISFVKIKCMNYLKLLH